MKVIDSRFAKGVTVSLEATGVAGGLGVGAIVGTTCTNPVIEGK